MKAFTSEPHEQTASTASKILSLVLTKKVHSRCSKSCVKQQSFKDFQGAMLDNPFF